ncbi:DUF3592 domain-containing protein [Spirochaeta lutea]|uniref:DUF3592 domain-containing protein n=1 Tax=Spirochaeta lutea TaxID=1480694 RepID=UPI0009DEE531|nr:DUF3592 domain-containing protein [Spirochaeta lutea]
MTLSRLFSRIFYVLGIVLIGVGGAVLVQKLVFQSSSVQTMGLVVDVRVVQNQVLFMDDGTGFHYYPTVEFSANDGRAYRFESPAGVTSVSYEKGQEVPVLYRTQDPGDAMIATTWGLYGLPIIFGGTGVLFVLFGLVAQRGFDKKKY